MKTKIIDYFNKLKDNEESSIVSLRELFLNFDTLDIEHDNPYHFENIDLHSKRVLDNLETKNDISMLAAIYHDIGKPLCKKRIEEENKSTYYGHDIVGAELAYNILSDIGFDVFTIEKIVKIIGQHQTLFSSTNRLGIWKHLRRLDIDDIILNVIKSDVISHKEPYLDKFYSIKDDFETYHKENVACSFDRFSNIELYKVMNLQPTAIMMIGSARSGKTTIVKEILSDFNMKVLSADSIRLENFNVTFDPQIEKDVWKIHDEMFTDYKKNKENFIIDNTNISSKNRKKYIEQLKKCGYNIIGIFVDTELNLLCHRAKISNMPIKVPIRMFSNLEIPDISEGFNHIFEKRS